MIDNQSKQRKLRMHIDLMQGVGLASASRINITLSIYSIDFDKFILLGDDPYIIKLVNERTCFNLIFILDNPLRFSRM